MRYNPRFKKSQLSGPDFITACATQRAEQGPLYETHTFPLLLNGEEVLQYACVRLSSKERFQCKRSAENWCDLNKVTDADDRADREDMELIMQSARVLGDINLKLFANIDQMMDLMAKEELAQMLVNYETTKVNTAGSIDYMDHEERKSFIQQMASESELDWTSFLGLITASTNRETLSYQGEILHRLKSGITSLMKSQEPITPGKLESLLKLIPEVKSSETETDEQS